MIKHDELRKNIEERVLEERRVLSEHYTNQCEREFMAAVKNNADFPIRIKVDVHLTDTDKKGATIIRNFFEKYDYRSVRTNYETGGTILVEIHKNGTAFTRRPN
ncbi:hypothetical protein VPHK567_0359 [Vibrio phage K567]